MKARLMYFEGDWYHKNKLRNETKSIYVESGSEWSLGDEEERYREDTKSKFFLSLHDANDDDIGDDGRLTGQKQGKYGEEDYEENENGH